MICSRYNYIYESKRHRKFFVYNSRTNSFMAIPFTLYEEMKRIERLSHKEQEIEIEHMDSDLKHAFIRAKVFVNMFDDDSFIQQKKLVRYRKCFQEQELGIVILPTFACNFACPYCYEYNLPAVLMNEETENQIIQFIKRSKGADNLHLCWHGGEPLLAFDNIKRLLKKIQLEREIKIKDHAMVSNGYLLDSSKCSLLKEYNPNVIQITIDGLRERHNKSRIHKNGSPTFDIILNNIENIFKIIPECHVIIRMNIHSENEKDYPLLHEMLTKRWGNQNYSIQMQYATKHENGCRIACIKSKNKILYACELYRSHDFKAIDFFPSPKIGGCVATYINSHVIGPKGEIYKCWVDVGKKDRVVGDIYSGIFNTELISEYLVGTDMFNDKKCRECLLFPVCDGGCNLKRLDCKVSGKCYDNCPIELKDMSILLDMFYEAKISS